MDKTLKSLHLRLDSTSKSLTKNAISQLIIKVLFNNENPISFKEIENGLKEVLKTSIDSKRIEGGVNKLLEQKEVQLNNKLYTLSRSRRRRLDKNYVESKNRLIRIVESHFTPYHSDESSVLDWFSDATIEFFKNYSLEWVSDLCHKNSKRVQGKTDDIFSHIKRRTNSNKSLDKKDHKTLVDCFVDCLTNIKDPDLDAHLWEYGTSAFAANLLQSSIGTDPISISAFKNSKCVLDTNVLMNIGLEASEYNKALKKLDVIFQQLNVTPGFFHITEQEYINTVSKINEEILKNVSRFDYSVIKETDDHFIQSAIKRGCRNDEDFETFCHELSYVPKYIDSKQKIEYFNDDPNLDIAIERAVKDEKKRIELNEIYKEARGKNKKDVNLFHDVGIIAGAEFYRQSEKAFILSQETSINRYSHSKPLIENLPLAIRLETIINMLAIDNGGTDVDPTDFSNLFADMIRFNLQPDKSTFKIADLSKILDTELQIEQLPAEEIVKIANTLHGNIARGLNEEEINLEVNRLFQDVRLKFVDELAEAKDKLAYEIREKERIKRESDNKESIIKDIYRMEESAKHDKTVMKNRLIWLFAFPLGVSIMILLGGYLYMRTNPLTNFESYILPFIISIIIGIITKVFVTKPILTRKTEKGKAEIDSKVQKRYEKGTK